MPLSYAYDDGDRYFFTTEGTKTEFIAANHEVCFQVEEVEGPGNWQSVMLTGRTSLPAADFVSLLNQPAADLNQFPQATQVFLKRP